MKSADKLKASLGAKMAESMGDVRPGGAGGLPAGFAAPSGQYAGCTRVKDALAIELDRIVPDPDQPRKEFDEGPLRDLAESLKARGQLQPIRVRWDEPLGKWVIIAGERRWRAAGLAGLAALVCIEARASQGPDDRLEDQLVENCVREDLKPIEQATAYRALMERRGWSYRELGEFLHISKGKIAKAVALLDLPEPVRAMVEQGSLAPYAAYEIARLDGDAERVEVAEQAVAEGLTAAQTSHVVKARKLGAQGPALAPTGDDRPRPIKVEVRPGITATVHGVHSEAEALEALREAANLLKRRMRDRAA